MSIEFVNFLLSLISQVSTQIVKDYMELEFLQSSDSKNRFIQNSIIKTKEKAQTVFDQLENMKIVFSDEDIYHETIENHNESVCFINLIDSLTNFSNALPYFALTLLISRANFQKRSNSYICIIYFPALQEVIYCIENQGAFFMKFTNQTKVNKLRCSAMQLKKNQDYYLVEGMQNKQEYLDLLDKYNLSIPNISSYGSKYFAANLVVRKKITKAFLFNIDSITQKCLQLLISECGMSFDLNKINNSEISILSSKYN